MKRAERITRLYDCSEKTKVADYLLVRQLRRLVQQAYADLPDKEAFWRSEPFEYIYRHRPFELDRLTLDNVLGRLNHCPNPKVWLREFRKIKSGRNTLVGFIASVIATRKS